MKPEIAYGHIERGAMMAGLRGAFPPGVALDAVHALLDGGINVIEFTMNSQQPIEAMQAVKKELGENVCAGMGTVLDVDMAQRCIDAGADFVVSPAFQPDVVEVVQKAGVLMIPGVITPTECVAAWGMGVPLLKLFPIGALGVDYYKAVIAPLAHMRFMANGAMHDGNAREFLRAGVTACGMAGWLTGDGSMPFETITRRARMLRKIVDEVRTGVREA
jgi:2-dehydro-3-deoxyphosphogluconate aldolase / (4S)-4-hydroxy-2-oxoglutarate aldolase